MVEFLLATALDCEGSQELIEKIMKSQESTIDKHGKRFWRGVDHSKTNYDDQPWEKEAYAKEKDLVDDYFIYLSDNQLPL